MRASPSCSLMVLNWNGAHLLEMCLPSIIEAAHRSGAEVVVVDNASTDGSRDLCAARFPEVRFEYCAENRVLASYNQAAENCKSDVIVFLNNDLEVHPNFVSYLLPHFENENLFGAACSIRSYPPAEDAAVEEGAQRVIWTRGMLRGEPFETRTPAPTFFMCGGAAAVNRVKFLEIGGFDDMYFYYHEDVDLSWRAWKAGWICLYEPNAIVYHMGGASAGRSSRVRTIMLRNEFLFHWKNLTSARLITSHLVTLAPRLLLAGLRGDRNRLMGFVAALRKLPVALRSRRQAIARFRRDDAEAMAAQQMGIVSS